MTVKQIQTKLGRLSVKALDSLEELLETPGLPPTTRLKVCNTILDRGGAPVLRATVNKTVTTSDANAKELLKVKSALLEEHAEVTKDLEAKFEVLGNA